MPHAHSVVCALGKLLGSIVHGVELSNLIGVSNFFEETSDLLAGSQLSEVVLLDAQLSVVGWEQKVNCFWLVSIVLKTKVRD